MYRRFINRLSVSAICIGVGLWAGEAQAAPLRTVSLSLCSDRAAAAVGVRPAAISYLGADPQWSPAAAFLAGMPTHRGDGEEILALHPDRAVGDAYTAPALLAALAHAHVPVILLPPVQHLNQREAYFAAAARAFGGQAPRIPSAAPPELRRTGILLEHGGLPAYGPTADEYLAAMGLRNGAPGPGPYDAEALLLLPVDVILHDPGDPLAARLRHLGVRTLRTFPPAPRLCPEVDLPSLSP